MIFKMTVRSREDVEIADLPEDVMDYIEANGYLVVFISLSEGGSDSNYAMIEVTPSPTEGYSKEEKNAFYTDISRIEGFRKRNFTFPAFFNTDTDESVESSNKYYFESDADDDYNPCEKWREAMNENFPNVRFE